MFNNEYILTVDIKKKATSIVPTFVQYDSASLLFKILDDGKPFDWTGFTRSEVSHKRPDGKTIIGEGLIETDSKGQKYIRYTYSGNEMGEVGFIQTSLSLFSSDKKVSIQPFAVLIVTDLRDSLIDSSKQEVGKLQELIIKVENLVDTANDAATSAEKAVKDAGKAIVDANMAKNTAETAANQANAAKEQTILATQEANTAVTAVNLAKTATETATTKANTATTQANTARDNANAVASTANTKIAEMTTLIADTTKAKNDAITATTNANTATTNANTARTNANTATTQANTARDAANLAKDNAITATTNANTATTQANTARDNANTAASNANAKIGEMNTLLTDTTKAKNDAITATTNANTATTNANKATTDANTATSKANTATTQANTARDGANVAKTNADLATARANEASASAEAEAIYANEQGSYAKAQGDAIQDIFDLGMITSVNEKTGAVVLNHEDVGAAPVNHTHAVADITGLSDEILSITVGKAEKVHKHNIADVTGLQSALDAKETPAGSQAKVDTHANNTTVHITSAERTAWNAKANGTHTHTIAQVTNLQTTLDAKETPAGAQTKVDTHANLKTNPHDVTKAQVGLSNVDNIKQATKTEFDTHTADSIKHVTAAERTAWNAKAAGTHTHAISEVTGLQTALDAKETPAGAQTKATKALTDANAYTDTKVAEIVGSAPETLDTLNELAQALGRDPNFATTVSTQIGTKVDTSIFNTHANDSSKHITPAERATWNAKAGDAHSHGISEITGLQSALDAKETPSGAQTKANTAETNAKNASVPTGRTVTAGNGLSGGGALSANVSLTLGTPGTLSPTSTNTVTATSHTHDVATATAAEAEAGTINTKFMTPLRTAEAIAALAPVAPVSSVAGKTGAVTLVGTDIPAGTTSARGTLQLSTAINSTSTTLAATASAVKTAYDLANGKADISHVHSAAEITSGVISDARLPNATTSAKGTVQLSTATNSTSTTLAATPSAVKAAYDLANGRETPTGSQAKVDAHAGDDAPHTYGGKFQWKFNSTTGTLDLVVLA